MTRTATAVDESEETVTVETEAELVSLEDVEALMAESKLERLHEQRANGVVNPIVLAQFLGVKPQMIYNYITNGHIKAAKVNSTGKKVIDLDEATAFARKYLDGKARKQAKIEAELRGE
jgi:hypothetical protein